MFYIPLFAFCLVILLLLCYNGIDLEQRNKMFEGIFMELTLAYSFRNPKKAAHHAKGDPS